MVVRLQWKETLGGGGGGGCLGRLGIFPFLRKCAGYVCTKANDTEGYTRASIERVYLWINHLPSSFLAIVSQKKLHIILQRTNDDD